MTNTQENIQVLNHAQMAHLQAGDGAPKGCTEDFIRPHAKSTAHANPFEKELMPVKED
tara:strand:+ start:927 stop:1100 length:174 start_codon:yes stop_codon:yes gene_type:complete